MNYLLAIAGCIMMGAVLFLVWHPSITNNNPLVPIYNDIAFPTGDHIIFYAQQQANTIANSLPGAKVIGTDTHGNYVVQNTTTNQIMNVSKTSPEGTLLTSSSTSSTNAGTTLSISGNSYGAGSTITNPTVTKECHAGQTCHITGIIVIADPATCHVQTVNGVQKNVCANLPGPFKYTMQIICVDTNAYRCSYLSGSLPTTHAESQPNGSFDYPWTPSSDPYYIGNYIARLYAVSETTGLNGQPIDESGDYQLQVIP